MGFIDVNGIFGDEGDDVDFFPVFYNLVHGVGENCPNFRDDVKMIQYLLFHIYKALSPIFTPKGNLTVDGICGGITKNWILKFQLDIRSTGNSILTDKRVDRIRDKNGMSGNISDTYYTMAYLNWYAAGFAKEAYIKLPQAVPLQHLKDVPPPSNDFIVPPPPRLVCAVGGL